MSIMRTRRREDSLRSVQIAGRALAGTVTKARAIARLVRRKHHLEPSISVAPASERSAICVITISYDRRTQGEKAAAARCYRSFAEEVMRRGYTLYRLTAGSRDGLTPRGEYTCLLGVS